MKNFRHPEARLILRCALYSGNYCNYKDTPSLVFAFCSAYSFWKCGKASAENLLCALCRGLGSAPPKSCPEPALLPCFSSRHNKDEHTMA